MGIPTFCRSPYTRTGRELLIDPGITSYEAADVERYLQTSYHNTICVDNRNQQRGPGTTDRWLTNAGLDYAAGTHLCIKGVTNSRRVLFVKPDYWVVLDEATGEGEHTCDQNWHFPADANISGDQASGVVHTSYPTDGNLLMAPIAPFEAKAGSIDFLISGALKQGERDTPAKGWRYSTSGLLPLKMGVVLYPFKGATAPNVAARRLQVSSGEAVALEVKAQTASDYIVVSRNPGGKVSIPEIGLEVEGELVVVRTQNGKPVEVRGCNVKSVTMNGESLVKREEPAADVNLSLPLQGSR